MHKFYFPKCEVKGDIDPPITFGHMGSKGAIPRKCSSCNMLFEGSCLRYAEKVNHYLHLDHGPCPVQGPTDPVSYENNFIRSKVEVPRKCASCTYLENDSIHGFHCTQDREKWGDFHRGLDWGAWQPESIYVELPLPKITTKKMIECVRANNQIEFIKEYRRVNRGLDLAEAKSDYKYLKEPKANES